MLQRLTQSPFYRHITLKWKRKDRCSNRFSLYSNILGFSFSIHNLIISLKITNRILPNGIKLYWTACIWEIFIDNWVKCLVQDKFIYYIVVKKCDLKHVDEICIKRQDFNTNILDYILSFLNVWFTIFMRYSLFVLIPDMHLKKRLYIYTHNLCTLIIYIIYKIYSLYMLKFVVHLFFFI